LKEDCAAVTNFGQSSMDMELFHHGQLPTAMRFS